MAPLPERRGPAFVELLLERGGPASACATTGEEGGGLRAFRRQRGEDSLHARHRRRGEGWPPRAPLSGLRRLCFVCMVNHIGACRT